MSEQRGLDKRDKQIAELSREVENCRIPISGMYRNSHIIKYDQKFLKIFWTSVKVWNKIKNF